MTKPSITEYTRLLHCHGVNSEVAKQYKQRHAHQDPFLKQAKVMDQVFQEQDPHRSTEGTPRETA
jgi:hypothetical protein